MHTFRVFLRHQLLLLYSEPVMMLSLMLGPVVLLLFLEPVILPTLTAAGLHGDAAVQHLVPGMSMMFSPILVNVINYGIFREILWRTRPRLTSSGLTDAAFLAVKMLLPLALGFLQFMFVAAFGALAFNYRLGVTTLVIWLTCSLLALVWVAIGLFLVTRVKSLSTANSITQVGLVFFAGMGGAIAPLPSDAPVFLEVIRFVSPTFWAMRMVYSAEFGKPLWQGLVGLFALAMLALLLVLVSDTSSSTGREQTI